MSSQNSESIFLDVDPSIVENNLRIAKEDDPIEEELNTLFGPKGLNRPSKLVKPAPGFCVKAREVGTEKKVFVNICKTDAIPPPKDVNIAELKKIIESDSGDYKVPMSIGELRAEKDKKGEDATVCDIAIHPDYLKKVEEIDDFKNFFMAIVFQALETKYGTVCADEKIILRNRKAFGKLQTHRIEQREIDEKMGTSGKKGLLEEISAAEGEQSKRKPVIETISSTENRIREPEYKLYKRKDGQNCLIGEFKLPDVLSAREMTLDIGEDRILFESKVRGYLLDIFVPYIIKQKGCVSSFDRSAKVLKVTMPLVGG